MRSRIKNYVRQDKITIRGDRELFERKTILMKNYMSRNREFMSMEVIHFITFHTIRVA